MKLVPIYDLGSPEPCLLRIPFIDIDTAEMQIRGWESECGPFYGLLAPYSDENLEFNIRCASRFRDRFPDKKIYIAVPRFKTYERIQTILRAGFSNIVVPLYLGGVEYDHYFQFINSKDVDAMILHIAGGKFSSETYNREGWTWSKETL